MAFENLNYKYLFNAEVPKYSLYDYRLEFIRSEQIGYMREKFKNLFYETFIEIEISERINKKLIDFFTSWLFVQISFKDGKSLDPVIPDYPLHEKSNVQLINDIANLTKKFDKSTDFVDSLELEDWIKKSLNKLRDKIKFLKDEINIKGIRYETKDRNTFLSITTEKVKIPTELYNRIVKLYTLNLSYSEYLRKDNNLMNYLIFLTIYRYNYVDPNNTRQGSLTQDVFNFMHDDYGIDFENFASIFNASSTSFNSLFYDLEKHFGGKGSYFTFTPIRGIYQSNPPLNEYLTKISVERQIKLLKDSKEPLMFVNFLPPWELQEQNGEYFGEFNPIQQIEESGFEVKRFYRPESQIKYINYFSGRITRFRAPVIIITANKQGREEYDVKQIEKIFEF
jgi:hypothetical protein